jgi:Family of unknown function (DUF6533)
MAGRAQNAFLQSIRRRCASRARQVGSYATERAIAHVPQEWPLVSNSLGLVSITRWVTPPYPERLPFSLAAFLYYDYILTLPDEVEYVWRSRWRLSTFFYILCRYALAANLIYYLSIAKDPAILEVRVP